MVDCIATGRPTMARQSAAALSKRIADLQQRLEQAKAAEHDDVLVPIAELRDLVRESQQLRVKLVREALTLPDGKRPTRAEVAEAAGITPQALYQKPYRI